MKISEQERLLSYHTFDTEVLDTVAEVAERQRSSYWHAIRCTIPEIKQFTPKYGKPIEVLDIIPESDYEGVHVYHLPIANTLDENMSFRLITLAEAQPTKRIVGVGNPGAPGSKGGKIGFAGLKTVWDGDLRPTIEPTMQYLSSQKIEDASQIGYSFGADKAAAAAQHADKYDISVPRGLLMEPASVKKRSLPGLAIAFGKTNEALQGYVDAADDQAYNVARALAEKRGHGQLGYIAGLGRLSNLAIAHTLAQDGFKERADNALTAQAEMKADIIWGSESELATGRFILAAALGLLRKYGKDRVRARQIEGQKHAMGEDIYLHTALVLQAQR